MGGGETGLKFFRDLVATNGLSVRQGHTLLNNLVISGEVPLALNVYNYMPEQAKKKGAPIDWFALEPAIARSNAVGVARHAPHPNAARLFYDYLLGEGQQYFVSMDYVPSNTKVASPLKGDQDRPDQPGPLARRVRTSGPRCSSAPSYTGADECAHDERCVSVTPASVKRNFTSTDPRRISSPSVSGEASARRSPRR